MVAGVQSGVVECGAKRADACRNPCAPLSAATVEPDLDEVGRVAASIREPDRARYHLFRAVDPDRMDFPSERARCAEAARRPSSIELLDQSRSTGPRSEEFS